MKKLLLLSVITLLAIGASSCKNSQDSSKSKESASVSESEKDFSYEDNPEAYKKLVFDFLEAINYEENVESQLAQSGINDPGLLSELREKVPSKLVKIYAKYYTANELKQLTDLHQDSLYKRFGELQPQIYQDYAKAGFAIGSGEPSPIEQIKVSSEFADAMEEYLKAQNFDKQLEKSRPLLTQNGLSSDKVDEIIKKMPMLMTKIYSKYFNVDEIKQLTLKEQLPIVKKFHEREVDMTTEIMKETENIVEEYYKTHQLQ